MGALIIMVGAFVVEGIQKTEGYMSNPRYHNGNRRRKNRARFKAMDAPCGICKGKLGPIHYDEPSDAQHPLSFVIDEIIPISRATSFGYASRESACDDWNNLQAAHWICNQRKSNHIEGEHKAIKHLASVPDGEW